MTPLEKLQALQALRRAFSKDAHRVEVIYFSEVSK